MPSPHEEILARAFCEVLEKQAFVFGEAVGKDELPIAESAHVKAEIGFSGAFSGDLVLTFPLTLCPVIAANILGKEPEEIAGPDWEDALRELANVTCGHVLTTLAGTELVFDLTIPKVLAMLEPDWEELRASADSVAFIVEDQPVLGKLTVAR